MEVKVLVFGPVAAAVGERVLSVEVPMGATAGVLRQRLAERHPALAKLLTGARLAINQEFAVDDALIQQGDEVALISPVSGG